MPSKKPQRRTGLYVAFGIVLALGALLYLMPDGLIPWSGHSDRAPGTVATPPPAAAPAVTPPEISGTQPASAGSAGSTGSRAASESPGGGPQPDTPVSLEPTPAPASPPESVARDVGPSGSPRADENIGGELVKSDAPLSARPAPSPAVSPQAGSETNAGSRPLPAGEVRSQETETAALSTPPEKAAPAEGAPQVAPAQPAETAGETAPEAAGTLDEELRRLAREKKLLIYFGRNSNEMQQNTFAKLDALSVFMRRHPMARLVIRGYTDSSGVYSYNKKLSKFRANMVKSYLVGKGTDSGRIRTLGMGPANPLKSNKSEKTRRFNRRVEIQILMNGG